MEELKIEIVELKQQVKQIDTNVKDCKDGIKECKTDIKSCQNSINHIDKFVAKQSVLNAILGTIGGACIASIVGILCKTLFGH